VLAGVVEDAVLRHGAGLIGAAHDVFQRLAFPFGAGDQLVAVVDIGLVVQVVVILQRLAAHAKRGQRVMGIGQIGKGEGHGKLRVSAHALRTVDHRGGLDAFLAKAKDTSCPTAR
jgi:hypothetical protein